VLVSSLKPGRVHRISHGAKVAGSGGEVVDGFVIGAGSMGQAIARRIGVGKTILPL
jgi:hypothetical protein